MKNGPGVLLQIKIPANSDCNIISISSISQNPSQKPYLIPPSVFKVIGNLKKDLVKQLTKIKLQFESNNLMTSLPNPNDNDDGFNQYNVLALKGVKEEE